MHHSLYTDNSEELASGITMAVGDVLHVYKRPEGYLVARTTPVAHVRDAEPLRTLVTIEQELYSSKITAVRAGTATLVVQYCDSDPANPLQTTLTIVE